MLLTALINLIVSSKNRVTWSNWAEEEAERQYQSEINNNIRLEHEQYQRDWEEGKIWLGNMETIYK